MPNADAKRIVADYLAALGDGDLEAVLALFADTGEVVSPLYGTLPAREFFTGLFAVTDKSTVKLQTVVAGIDSGSCIAAAFDYEWEMANGERVTFPVVATFRLDDTGKITHMVILYGASAAHEKLSKLTHPEDKDELKPGARRDNPRLQDLFAGRARRRGCSPMMHEIN